MGKSKGGIVGNEHMSVEEVKQTIIWWLEIPTSRAGQLDWLIAVVRDETLAELRTAESNFDMVATVLDAGGQLDQLQARAEVAEARAARFEEALTNIVNVTDDTHTSISSESMALLARYALAEAAVRGDEDAD